MSTKSAGNKLLKSGVLTKKAANFPFQWQARIFSLYPQRLDYLGIDGSLKGTIDINAETSVMDASVNECGGKANGFKILSMTKDGSREMLIYANTALEKEEWDDAISSAVEALKDSQRNPRALASTAEDAVSKSSKRLTQLMEEEIERKLQLEAAKKELEDAKLKKEAQSASAAVNLKAGAAPKSPTLSSAAAPRSPTLPSAAATATASASASASVSSERSSVATSATATTTSGYFSPTAAAAARRASAMLSPASAPTVVSEVMVKSGYLTKKGSSFPYSWQGRSFSLYPSRIQYATVGGVVKGSFPITSNSVLESVTPEVADGHWNAFRLVVHPNTAVEKELIMYANSSVEKEEWMDAIAAAISPGEYAAAVAAEDSSAASMLNSSAHSMPSLNSLILSAENTKGLDEDRISKRKLEQLTTPFRCFKKLDFETSYQERFLWVDITKATLHWSKTADAKKSKYCEIRDYVVNVETNVLGVSHPNVKITLDPENLPPSLVSGTGMLKKNPSSIDLYINTPAPFGLDPQTVVNADTELCSALRALLIKIKRNVH